jgi:hypothetical protein
MATKMTEAEQQALCEQLTIKWIEIGRKAGATDRLAAEAAVIDIYKSMNLPPPMIFWGRSPLEIRLMFGILENEKVANKQVAEVAAKEYKAHMRIPKAYEYLKAQIAPYELVSGEPEIEKLENLNFEAVAEQAYNVVCAYGQHDVNWIAADLAQSIINDTPWDSEPYGRLAENASWWIARENLAIISDLPIHLRMDASTRQHSLNEASMLFGDGFGTYLVHGTPVPEEYVLKRSELTVEQVMGESNQGVRRALMELYGMNRLLKNLNAKEISRVGTGLDERVLYDIPATTDNRGRAQVGEQIVSVIDATPEAIAYKPTENEPSVFINGRWHRVYWLWVSGQTSASAAVANTFGLPERLYAPARAS